MNSLGNIMQEMKDIIQAAGGEVYAFPFIDSISEVYSGKNIGFQYPYRKNWYSSREDYFEIDLKDPNCNIILQHLAVMMISLDSGFILTKPDFNLFEGPKNVQGGNSYLNIKEMICAFTRESFLAMDEIYSLGDNNFYQVQVEGVSTINYEFDPDKWRNKWGFEFVFTGHRGGQDFDWYKKLILYNDEYRHFRTSLIIGF